MDTHGLRTSASVSDLTASKVGPGRASNGTLSQYPSTPLGKGFKEPLPPTRPLSNGVSSFPTPDSALKTAPSGTGAIPLSSLINGAPVTKMAYPSNPPPAQRRLYESSQGGDRVPPSSPSPNTLHESFNRLNQVFGVIKEQLTLYGPGSRWKIDLLLMPPGCSNENGSTSPATPAISSSIPVGPGNHPNPGNSGTNGLDGLALLADQVVAHYPGRTDPSPTQSDSMSAVIAHTKCRSEDICPAGNLVPSSIPESNDVHPAVRSRTGSPPREVLVAQRSTQSLTEMFERCRRQHLQDQPAGASPRHIASSPLAQRSSPSGESDRAMRPSPSLVDVFTTSEVPNLDSETESDGFSDADSEVSVAPFARTPSLDARGRARSQSDPAGQPPQLQRVGLPLSRGKLQPPISFSKHKRKPIVVGTAFTSTGKPRSSRNRDRSGAKRKNPNSRKMAKRNRLHSKTGHPGANLTIRLTSGPRVLPNVTTSTSVSPPEPSPALPSANTHSQHRTALEDPMGRLEITQGGSRGRTASNPEAMGSSDSIRSGVLPPLPPAQRLVAAAPDSPSNKENRWRELVGRVTRRGPDSGQMRKSLEEKLRSPIKRLTSPRHSRIGSPPGEGEPPSPTEGPNSSPGLLSLLGLKKRVPVQRDPPSGPSQGPTGHQLPTPTGYPPLAPAPKLGRHGGTPGHMLYRPHPADARNFPEGSASYAPTGHPHPSFHHHQHASYGGSPASPVTTPYDHPPHHNPYAVQAYHMSRQPPTPTQPTNGSASSPGLPPIRANCSVNRPGGVHTDASRYYRQVTASRMAPYISTSRFGIPYHPAKRRRSVYAKWSPAEDILLRVATCKYGEKNWDSIAREVPGRTYHQCRQRWNKSLKLTNPLTPEELRTGKLGDDLDIEGARTAVQTALNNSQTQPMGPDGTSAMLSPGSEDLSCSPKFPNPQSPGDLISPYLTSTHGGETVPGHFSLQHSPYPVNAHPQRYPPGTYFPHHHAETGATQPPTPSDGSGYPPLGRWPTAGDRSSSHVSASSSTSSLISPSHTGGPSTIMYSPMVKPIDGYCLQVAPAEPPIPRCSEGISLIPPSPLMPEPQMNWPNGYHLSGSSPIAAHHQLGPGPVVGNGGNSVVSQVSDATLAPADERSGNGYRRTLQKVSSRIGRIVHGNGVSDSSQYNASMAPMVLAPGQDKYHAETSGYPYPSNDMIEAGEPETDATMCSPVTMGVLDSTLPAIDEPIVSDKPRGNSIRSLINSN
ncbi:hypothetical protein H4R33_001483 [Dimargaris cristalligena]|nr:hypothetical protein H4R33_001483 [Dimargaris cristalligena]